VITLRLHHYRQIPTDLGTVDKWLFIWFTGGINEKVCLLRVCPSGDASLACV